MLSKEEFSNKIDSVREKIGEEASAMVSEDLLATLAEYNNTFDEYEKVLEENGKLKEDKEELLKVNGKLYQKIGFEDKEEKEEKEDDDEEKIEISDVINEKGELI